MKKYQIANGGEVVEAIQWTGSGSRYPLFQEFDPKGYRNDGGFGPDWFLTSSKLFANVGDWLVKFQNGLVVPVSHQTFTSSTRAIE